METKKNTHKFSAFLKSIRKALSQPLPGNASQGKMSPPHRPIELRIPKINDEIRESAVLILLWQESDQINTVFILRPEYDGVHSNQIAFPGGKSELQDADFVATALREANEEIGVDPKSITILGQLSPLYIHPSHFMVYPVVGFSKTPPNFVPDPVEIKEVIPCNLFDFFKPDAFTIHDFEVRGKILPNVPCYKIDGQYIWGATAMIFSELLDIIQPLDRP